MLKLFVTALLLRGCLPAVASSDLHNTHNLKESRRSMSNNGSHSGSRETRGLVGMFRKLHCYVWSLTSNQGDSVMKLVEIPNSRLPGIKCTGNFDDESNLVKMDAASTPSISMITIRLQYKRNEYYLSVKEELESSVVDNKYMVVTKASNGGIKDSERFIQWEYRGFSMFESFARRGRYLGCNTDGSLHLINVFDMLLPDPRVLFIIHAKP